MSVTQQSIFGFMRDQLKKTFQIPDDQIEPTTTFGELELDSLALAELAVLLGEELGVTVTEDGITAETTLAEFAGEVEALVAPARAAQ
ncbi:phosphopantetheine-binding protein [Streptomyces filamentosus]|uniref:Phosphopantetheine-binding protein n=2 Tax=Streptomyces filamentosus TaxID=67294 RepID=A0ABY4URE6_STRFL|nr:MULTISPECIES: phosphopantetheine-binding protein [Streptomyces]EFE77748.1 predicted protein [Streptomyces filamentosus NRRL 15998]ESU50290.1 hypothetical protein P376_1731 [Streptomyces sp. HCCB10043]EWS94674.1 hypothetical protein SSIG_05338 [Streptomyces filamentosus NRRL 11379]MYR81664.1 acyl carrier protein [Streptomyces sp. SID5466]USC46875.1 phosphopantetheine-binding protein [Streptomyces filamentosus]